MTFNLFQFYFKLKIDPNMNSLFEQSLTTIFKCQFLKDSHDLKSRVLSDSDFSCRKTSLKTNFQPGFLKKYA